MIESERDWRTSWQRRERIERTIRRNATPLAKEVMLNEFVRSRKKDNRFCDSCNRRKHPAHQRCIGMGNDAWRALAS
jgi:hypothetical protein